jgi:hypothetical protein
LRLAPSALQVNPALVHGGAANARWQPIDVSLYKFIADHSRKDRAMLSRRNDQPETF